MNYNFRSPCMGKNLSVLLEEDAHGVSDSSNQNSPYSSTTGNQPTQHVSSFLGFSEPMSAEVWTLSRSSARQIDSGHSSSLTNSSSCPQKKQSKGSDITESSFLDSDISKRCVWTGDFCPSLGAEFRPYSQSKIVTFFPNTMSVFPK